MNDPNGLAYFNQKYYVFFQWYPFAPVHGLKHWGKTTSKDLIHWSEQEPALIPDRHYEKNGCYSGNAFEYEDKLYLFYTANFKTPAGKIPKQALAIMDKDEKIIKVEKLIIDSGVEGLSGELRDPYVFSRNGLFYMLLGGSKFEGDEHPGFGEEGVLLLYKSENLLDWNYQGLIDLPIDTGYMLECPSLIEVDGKEVLFLSPMGMASDETRLNNRFATVYLVGELDLEERIFKTDQWDEMDAGFDFYAPQAFYKEKQPLMMAWFGCGEPEYPVDEQWQHGLTFTQKLHLKHGKLLRFPVDEILGAFSEGENVTTKSIMPNTSTYHLQLTDGFDFRVGSKEDYWSFTYDTDKEEACISREGLDQIIDETFGFERKAKVKHLTVVDVFVDNSFVEIYLNEGEIVFSFRVFQQITGTIYSTAHILVGTLNKKK
ncbi:sucrose-6-phosphate hydrolase [Enterococcus gilvus]|nr:sucrose-6-phosphate hydrolase [Enterococcus gilvus]